ncbi:hypothetical protein ATANTOWER_012517 [Ataeniobius toweri]|uniref:Uncharacterized protein n=1 Tax=Ataeniobius toweri TaxID=208326 RepID=A0ABU7A5W4_9TELE|nr:hypothetical protein [Ataeniobius toweri]
MASKEISASGFVSVTKDMTGTRPSAILTRNKHGWMDGWMDGCFQQIHRCHTYFPITRRHVDNIYWLLWRLVDHKMPLLAADLSQ